MLTILVLVVVGLLPFFAGFGVLLWGALFRGNADATSLARGVALGLVAGALGGILVGLTLLGLVLALVHLR
jgi:hypothetical protein